jgi:hypothetical protein
LDVIFNKTIEKAPQLLYRVIIDVSLYAPKNVYLKNSEILIADALIRDVESFKLIQKKIEVMIVLNMSADAKSGNTTADINY